MPTEILGDALFQEFNDYTAISQMLFELSEGIAFPSVAYFQNTSFDITYIAARHASGHGIKHPTCQKYLKNLKR